MKEVLRIEKLGSKDLAYFKALIKLFEEVFEMNKLSVPKNEYLSKLLTQERFHVFVALHADTVIGGLTAYTLEPYYGIKPLAYIFDLAVSRHWQRKEVGSRLIARTKSYFRENGYEELFVQAHKIDKHAINFY